MFRKHNFSRFEGILGTFDFLVKEEAKNFRGVAKGGGREISDASLGREGF